MYPEILEIVGAVMKMMTTGTIIKKWKVVK